MNRRQDTRRVAAVIVLLSTVLAPVAFLTGQPVAGVLSCLLILWSIWNIVRPARSRPYTMPSLQRMRWTMRVAAAGFLLLAGATIWLGVTRSQPVQVVIAAIPLSFTVLALVGDRQLPRRWVDPTAQQRMRRRYDDLNRDPP